MAENLKTEVEFKSGINWIFFSLGVLILGLFLIGGISNPSRIDYWVIGAIVAHMIWMAWPGQTRISDEAIFERNWYGRYKVQALSGLKWIDFKNKHRTVIYFEDTQTIFSKEQANYKQIRNRLKKIASMKLPYYGYEKSERSRVKHSQLLGCLDCHDLFPTQEVKSWWKLKASFWLGQKKDEFYAKCPSCQAPWVFSVNREGKDVTLEAIKQMDKAMKKDEFGIRRFSLL